MHRLRILILTTLVLTACSAADASPTPTLFVPPTLEATATQQLDPTGVPAATDDAATEPTEAAAALPTIPATPLGRPEAPAAIEADFRPDSAAHVAATGRPQLIEFFTFW